ncbi:hypothetical protein AC1031_020225 [Aphanomyces cochlioides]|nr:hypothetical protein AC1031_020225 [Aphanomyces cochlioides]
MARIFTALVSLTAAAVVAAVDVVPSKMPDDPTTLFSATTQQQSLAPPRNLDSSVVNLPIPTNRWWSNLISTGKDAKEVLRVWTNPYAIAPLPTGLQISYPAATRAFGGSSGNGNGNKYYLHASLNDLTISAAESERANATSFRVMKWDDLGVNIRKDAVAGKGSIEAYLVSGMAFVTAKYTQLSPILSTEHAISSVNDQKLSEGQTVSGTKFTIALNNAQTWVVYTSTSVTFIFHNSQLIATAPFSGTVQVAMAKVAADVAVYDKYKDCTVQGGKVTTATTDYTFAWTTQGACSNGLLHFALTHHSDSIDGATATAVQGLSTLDSTTRGRMLPFATKTTPPVWKLLEPTLANPGFYPRQKPTADRVSKTNLLKNLKNDIGAAWSLPLDGSYYFNGKAAQKYASLCLMASDASVVGNDKSLLAQCRVKLETILAPFVANSWKYPLVYDTVYKGVVSSQGFAVNDLNADFGNTVYNDHHYHYGYWIVTAAIANLVHPTMKNLDLLNRRIQILIRDVANDNAADAKFPVFRMFDWYRGHSYSHGITALADGKDQESTSEETNFHYGALLFGQVTKQPALERLGRLMLTVNARAINTYFLMDSANRVHPKEILPNKVPGIFFDNKADYATWFSPEKWCIHGIQMIPVSPATEFVRTTKFVKEEWTEVLSKTSIVAQSTMTNAWLSLLYANYAAVDPNTAMDKLQTVALDDGLTRSWALYMAASRYV